MSSPQNASAILLAAGGSTRLGRPKQLLPWNGTTLIGWTIRQLVEAECRRLIIVIGAYEGEVREHCLTVGNAQIEIVTNPDWCAGQATSLRVGIQSALARKDLHETLIAVCDQPLITSLHYRELVSKVKGLGYDAAATEYREGLGVPVCASVSALQNLAAAVGESGAKKWLRAQSPASVCSVACSAAALDIDTELDYQERLKHGEVV